MQVVVSSLAANYERAGQSGKPQVVVLHGWGDSAAGWRSMQARLSEHYDVIVPDLPGFGGTPTPETAWDLNDYAAFVGGFITKLKLKPAAIIGHSNGGAIAVRGLSNGVFATERLVLLDSAGLRSDYKGRNKVLRILTKTGKVLTLPLPNRLKKRIRRAVYKTVGSDMLVKEDLQESFKRIVTDDIQASAAKVAVPTLLIYGEDDEATPVQYGRILHSLIDGSTLEVITGAGHFVHLDKPDQVERSIAEFIG